LKADAKLRNEKNK